MDAQCWMTGCVCCVYVSSGPWAYLFSNTWYIAFIPCFQPFLVFVGSDEAIIFINIINNTIAIWFDKYDYCGACANLFLSISLLHQIHIHIIIIRNTNIIYIFYSLHWLPFADLMIFVYLIRRPDYDDDDADAAVPHI